jgi:hypothetical protein
MSFSEFLSTNEFSASAPTMEGLQILRFFWYIEILHTYGSTAGCRSLLFAVTAVLEYIFIEFISIASQGFAEFDEIHPVLIGHHRYSTLFGSPFNN